MKQRTFLESFIARPRPVFKIYLFLSTNFESHQIQNDIWRVTKICS